MSMFMLVPSRGPGSTADCQVGMHVLNNSFDFHEYENSLHVNMVNMACHNNQSGERSINVDIFSFENLHSSTHEPPSR